MRTLPVSASLRLSFSSLLQRTTLLFAAGLTAAASAQTPAIVIDGATGYAPGGTVNVGEYSPTGSGGSGPTWHFTAPVTITSIAYDPGPGGIQELSVRSLYGCPYNQPTTGECGVETEFSPRFPGLRSGTLRITTTSGVFIIPVTYNVYLPQAALTPGTLSSPAVLGGQPVTTTGQAIALDAAGNLYLGDTNGAVVRKVDATTGAVTVFAGTLNNPSYSGDGGPATSATIMNPYAISVSPSGDLYIASRAPYSNDYIRKVDLATGNISTAAISVTGRSISVFAPAPDGTATADDKGNIFVAVPFYNQIQEISNGVTTTILNGTVNGSPCNTSPVYTPQVTTVSGGYIYFANGTQVFKLSTDTTSCHPVIPIVAGPTGNSGDGGPAINAQLRTISGLAVDPAGNLYIADAGNNILHVVNASTGIISSIAGAGTALPSLTIYQGLDSLALDPRGNLYVLATDGTVQKIDVSQTSLTFADTVTGNTSTDSPQSVLTTNIGNYAFAAGTSSIPLGFAIDPSTTCISLPDTTATLQPAATCTAVVNFSPVNAGNIAGPLTYMGVAVNLSGKAIPSTTIDISPSSIDFGTVMQGSTSGTWTINIANTGDHPLTITSSAIVDSSDFQVTGSCYAPIAPYSSCNLTVVFRPQRAGTLNGSLTLNDNAGSGTQTVTFTGTATSNAPVISVSPTSVDFGTITAGSQSATWTVYVSNSGPSPLLFNGITLSDTTNFHMAHDCHAQIPAYGACTISLTFTPQTANTFNAHVTIVNNSNATVTNTIVSLTGAASAPPMPVVQISPSPIDFGNIPVNGTSATWTVWIGNTGPATLNISSFGLADTTNFSLSGYCATIPPYGSCEVQVAFTPKSKGTFSTNLSLTDNAASGTQTLPLSGKGTDPNYTVNVTPAALTIRAGATGTASFLFTPTGGFTGSATFTCNGLPAGAACSFSPATLTADGSDTPQTSTLTVTTSGVYGLASTGNHGEGIAFAGLLGFLAIGALRRRNRLPALLLAAFAFVGLASMSGCGAGIYGAATPIGAHSVQVTATATATQKTQTGTTTAGTSNQSAPLTITITE